MKGKASGTNTQQQQQLTSIGAPSPTPFTRNASPNKAGAATGSRLSVASPATQPTTQQQQGQARPKTADAASTKRQHGWKAVISVDKVKEAYKSMGGSDDGKALIDAKMVKRFLADTFEDFGDARRWDRLLPPHADANGGISYDDFFMIVLKVVKQ